MSNRATTNPTLRYLTPSGTTTESPGQSTPLELGSLAGKTLLLVLRIEETLEQESLHVSIWGSDDGENWGATALFWFPQKFHSGVTPAALDLRLRPELNFLQVRWEVNRWGRGVPRPYFKFAVEVQEAGN
ncbi:MAG: hypothetical protein ABSF14_03620 [Terriglobia bacterium]